MRRSKASTAMESGEESDGKPVVRGVLTDTSIGIEDPNITRHFVPRAQKKINPFLRSSFNVPLSQRPAT